MRMTVKGQVTIPKYIRDALDIHPGDELDWVVEGDSARITRRANRAEIEAALDEMTGSATANVGIPTDEIMKWLRG
jgi:AbrB family looped-hinge helix DNA binding protein